MKSSSSCLREGVCANNFHIIWKGTFLPTFLYLQKQFIAQFSQQHAKYKNLPPAMKLGNANIYWTTKEKENCNSLSALGNLKASRLVAVNMCSGIFRPDQFQFTMNAFISEMSTLKTLN